MNQDQEEEFKFKKEIHLEKVLVKLKKFLKVTIQEDKYKKFIKNHK